MKSLNNTIQKMNILKSQGTHNLIQKFGGEDEKWKLHLDILYHKNVYDKEYLWNEISRRLKAKESFMVGRMGNTESILCGEYLKMHYGINTNYSKDFIDSFYNVAGFFSKNNRKDETDVDKYVRITLGAIKYCDIFMCWFPLYLDYIANNFAKNAVLTSHDILPFSVSGGSWTKSLEGKKVLIVSPFEKSVEYQYNRKDKIVRNYENELPDFDLLTYKTVVTQCRNNENNFKDWFEAYHYMQRQISEIDFDVAIVGAGSYGFPLSAAIRKSGKVAIEMCGLTPLMFGIAGERHIQQGYLKKYGTDAWIRPLEEPPRGFKTVEKGCYW